MYPEVWHSNDNEEVEFLVYGISQIKTPPNSYDKARQRKKFDIYVFLNNFCCTLKNYHKWGSRNILIYCNKKAIDLIGRQV